MSFIVQSAVYCLCNELHIIALAFVGLNLVLCCHFLRCAAVLGSKTHSPNLRSQSQGLDLRDKGQERPHCAQRKTNDWSTTGNSILAQRIDKLQKNKVLLLSAPFQRT